MPTTSIAPCANLELFGHEPAIATLDRALGSGRMPHAWLFYGPEGIGKATLAYRFARALLAGERLAAARDLAPEHPVARQVAAGSHPDLHVVAAERDAKTGRVKSEIAVDAVRQVTQALHATAACAPRRVVVVDGAEQLNRNAANALLKPLEEPPPATVLILISHRPGQVAATLRSRCAKLPLAGLPAAVLLAAIAPHTPDWDDERRRALVTMARGSLGRALELASAAWQQRYRELLAVLAQAPVDHLRLHDQAGELAKYAATRGFMAPVALLQELLGRLLAQRLERLGPALFAEEEAWLAALAARLPLEAWAGLWEKIARLSTAVDGLNLDRSHALVQILTLLAGGGAAQAAPRLQRARP